MKVIIDTSAFIALFVKTDKNHVRAKSIYDTHKKLQCRFYTTPNVLSELFTRVLYFGDSSKLKTVVSKIDKAIKDRHILLLEVDENTFEKSKAVMLKYDKSKTSFVDCTTFVLYRDFAIDEIFTFDDDFKKLGALVSY